MKQFLEKVRTAQWQSLPKQIIATTGVVLLGFALGVLQKWMDGSSNSYDQMIASVSIDLRIQHIILCL